MKASIFSMLRFPSINKGYILIIVVCVCFMTEVIAQRVDWLKAYGSKGRVDNTRCVIAEKDGGCTNLISVGWINPWQRPWKDTIAFDSYKFELILDTTQTVTDNTNFIVRLDANGNVINAVKIDSRVEYITKDIVSGDLFAFFSIRGDTNRVINSTPYSSFNGDYIVAKLDSNFNYQWITQIGSRFTNFSNRPIIYSNGHLFFTCSITGTTTLGTSTYTTDPGTYLTLYGEFNTSDGNFIWSNRMSRTVDSSAINISDIVPLKGKFYLSGSFNKNVSVSGTSDSTYVIMGSGDTIYFGNSFIVSTDQTGNIEKCYVFKGGKINTLVTDGKDIFFGGLLTDTMLWGTKKIIPQSNRSSYGELFISSIDPSFKPGWFFQASTNLNRSKNHGYSSIVNQMVFNNGFLYIRGTIFDTLMIDNNVLIPRDFNLNGYPGTSSSLLLMKQDLLGNILWATAPGGDASCMDALEGDGVFAGGNFVSKLQMDTYTITATGYFPYYGIDAFVVKIRDYSITRGLVKSGPYCAGDTILVPYAKVGNYDSDNVFIAQLSNEDGNFDKGHRELGRIISDTSGVIIGKLPMFQVASSPNYRIRIISTKPPVQSYYKADTLKLLIYSRDKADPGNDTLICYGDTVTLNTFGGTKWTWSPAYNMQDSQARKTLAWPAITTRYKIIIADSSGCGDADTAYKTIYVRKALNVKLDGDSIICPIDTTNLRAIFSGGDSSAYEWKWFEVPVSGNWKLLKSGTGKYVDSFSYHLQSLKPEKLAVILGDYCSQYLDTSFITVRSKDTLSISLSSNDTILCVGRSNIWKAIGKGGDKDHYKFEWTDTMTNLTLSNSDSLKIDSPVFVRLKLTDGCMNDPTYTTFNVSFRKLLNLQILDNDFNQLKDTILCHGQRLKLIPNVQGGDSTAYAYNWSINGKTISTSSKLDVDLKKYLPDSGSSSEIHLILSDNCTIIPDTFSIKLQVLPALKVSTSVIDHICFPGIAIYRSTATGGNKKYSYNWFDPSFAFQSDGDSLVLSYQQESQTGYQKRICVLTDGCSLPDTSDATVRLIPRPLAYFELSTDKVSLSYPTLMLHNKSQWSSSFIWDIPKLGIYTESNPILTLKDTGDLLITLIAISSEGCRDTFDRRIFVYEPYRLYVPNSFSPNNDGHNDVFHPAGYGFEYISYSIYNRWGEIVYSTANNEPWDGTYEGSFVQDGIYMYIMEAQEINGLRHYYNGQIVIIR